MARPTATGQRVRLTGQHLRNTGQLTGHDSRATWRVVALENWTGAVMGRSGRTIANGSDTQSAHQCGEPVRCRDS